MSTTFPPPALTNCTPNEPGRTIKKMIATISASDSQSKILSMATRSGASQVSCLTYQRNQHVPHTVDQVHGVRPRPNQHVNDGHDERQRQPVKHPGSHDGTSVAGCAFVAGSAMMRAICTNRSRSDTVNTNATSPPNAAAARAGPRPAADSNARIRNTPMTAANRFIRAEGASVLCLSVNGDNATMTTHTANSATNALRAPGAGCTARL